MATATLWLGESAPFVGYLESVAQQGRNGTVAATEDDAGNPDSVDAIGLLLSRLCFRWQTDAHFQQKKTRPPTLAACSAPTIIH